MTDGFVCSFRREAMAERMQEAPFVGPYLLQNVLGKGQTGMCSLFNNIVLVVDVHRDTSIKVKIRPSITLLSDEKRSSFL